MALFDNILEIKKHNSAINSGIELINIQSFIDDAINYFLIPAIGFEQLQELITAKPSLEESSKEYRLLQLLQKSAVGYTIANYTDNGSVVISNTGIGVNKSEKLAPASDKKLILLKRNNLKAAYKALELAIDFLEANINDFEIYKASNEHKRNRSLLINNTAEFESAGVYLKGDAQLFDSLKTYIDNATEDKILSLLGGELLATIKEGVLNANLSEAHGKLLKKVRKPLAALAMVEAIPYRTVTIDANGVFELSETVGGISGNVENRASATDKRLNAIMCGLSIRADQELETIQQYLNNNADDLGITTTEPININDGSAERVYFL